MSQTIGTLELTSIVKGMEADDAVLKSTNVNLLVGETIYPGKFLLMFGGNVGAVQQAIAIGTSLADDVPIDSPVLPNIHASVLPAINELDSMDKRQIVGIVETQSVTTCICAIDWAVKASNVTLIRIHMAFGTGGRRYMVAAGGVFDVDNAVTVASGSAGGKGLLVYRSVISRPHGSMWWQTVEG